MRLTRLALSVVLGWVLVFGAASYAGAAGLAPSKPSQVVTVSAFTNDAPPCFQGSSAVYQIVNRGNADGTASPFVIPPKSVFVATSVDFVVGGATANTNQVLFLIALDPAHPPVGTNFPALATFGGLADANGAVVGNAEIPAGLVVKPPAVLCAQLPSSNANGIVSVHGFFAKDK